MKHGEIYGSYDDAMHQQVNRALLAGITLNLLFVVVEAVAGFMVNSLSLLSDAGHNLADVVTLALSLLAFRLMKVKPNEQYTYGYRKTSILVALFNTMFLLVSIGAIIYEAVHRVFVPETTAGGTIAVVAAVGIVINSITAFLFIKNKDRDINIKSAYLHLVSDALISAGIVGGGLIIYFTGWYWIDSLFSIVVALIILFGAWKLLVSSLRLSLDGVPADINIEDVREAALNIKGIREIHHIHVWAISTTENALTAHLVLASNITGEEELEIKQQFREKLRLINIGHVTLETEKSEEDCITKRC
jgi:cobalt-zinc-cadmium efflux system protein